MNFGFWMRWAWRDLRARWVQVLAIALIIALGTGVFAGLGGQETWRKNSYDLSYDRLHMFDLHVKLADGSFVPGDAFIAELSDIPGVGTVEPRLINPTLVDASHDDETILVRGSIIGVDVADGGPHVNGIYVDEADGRNLTGANYGKNTAIVEYKFARHYDLKPGDPIRISGGTTLDFVGAGHSPEYFIIMPDSGAFFAEASFAVIFVPLETAQRLANREGLVNDAVILLQDGADREAVKTEIENRIATAFPDIGVEVTTKDDDAIYATLYADAEGDQTTWNLVAALFLIGAALGAFNLAGRMVESQRRQIGIGMALGVPRLWIAFRPMLVGLQIAALGTVLGLVFGYGIGQLFADQLRTFAPLPYYKITFYLPGYIRATLIGILLPFIATLIPVWRAVRVNPIDAIQTGYLVAKGGGLTSIANFLPLPGHSFTQMPIKNILRAPWRTLLTVFGIAIAIMLLTVMVGALDTYVATMDQADSAYRHEGRDRVLINLDFFYPADNSEVSAIRDLKDVDGKPLVREVEPALMLGGKLMHDDVEIETVLELHAMDNAIWKPALLEGSLQESGIIISEKAAKDLGIAVGDTVMLEHPLREGLLSFRLVTSEIVVSGIHDNPLRPLSYMDLSGAEMMGLADTTNLLVVNPAEGVTADDLKYALLIQPGVASVEPISEFSEAIENLLALVTNVLRVVQVVVLVLAFLIAFKLTSISVDERVREIATMFAFGLPIRTVTRMQMLENLVIGFFGTLVGLGIGWGVLNALFTVQSPQLEDIHFIITISSGTLIVSLILGVLIVALTPLLSIQRMRRMDIPSTLRVME